MPQVGEASVSGSISPPQPQPAASNPPIMSSLAQTNGGPNTGPGPSLASAGGDDSNPFGAMGGGGDPFGGGLANPFDTGAPAASGKDKGAGDGPDASNPFDTLGDPFGGSMAAPEEIDPSNPFAAMFGTATNAASGEELDMGDRDPFAGL